MKQTNQRPLAGSALALLFVVACQNEANQPAPVQRDLSISKAAFQNAVNEPPLTWMGPVFELNHDYPKSLPEESVAERAPWLKRQVDFASAPVWSDGWDDYMADLLGYIRAGQDPELSDAAGWSVDVDGDTRWYHVPWMATNPSSGREFVHGLTNERTAHLSDLIGLLPKAQRSALVRATNTTDDPGFETWAFGVYNEFGGYSIGSIIPPSGVPQTAKFNGGESTIPRGLPFAQGTLVTKLLFTTADADSVPYLAGAPEWQANRHDLKSKQQPQPRTPQTVRLVQIDVAVVDDRSPSGWVYGTFAYDGTIDAKSPWDRLSPVGLQWGSDPKTFPAVGREESVPVTESVLAPIKIYEHLGPEGRLAGPADNPQSSCVSCHSAAFAAPVGTPGVMGTNVPPIFGFDGMGTSYNRENIAYFGNRIFPEAYGDTKYAGTISLDTSLQLLVAFNSYAEFVSARSR